MASKYITFPMPVDAEALIQKSFDYLQTKNPSWEPSEGGLATWVLEAAGGEGADIGTLASQVDLAIFKTLGEQLIGIPPKSATPATSTVIITAIDTAGYTFVAGMQMGIRDTQGNLIAFKLANDVTIAPGSSVSAASLIVAAVAGSSANGIGSISGSVEMIDVNPNVASIAQQTLVSGGQDDETVSGYNNRLSFEIKTMSPRPILPKDFSILALKIAGVQRALTIDGYNPYQNMLTVDEAGFETSVAHYSGTNCTISSSTDTAAEGTHSMKMVASSAADMHADLIQANEKTVYPGDTITAIAQFKTAVTARACKVGIAWYTSGDVLISTSYSATSNDNTSTFTQVSVTDQAPSTAAYARLVLFVTAPANAEVHYVDKALLGKGNITTWVAGGSTATNQERMVTIYALDSSGALVGSTVKSDIKTYFEGTRELNFMINVDDATSTQVDVTSIVIVLPDYDLSDVQSRVVTAINNFLNPQYWGVSPDDDPNDPSTWVNVAKVYYLELASVINNVIGVDRVSSLTLGAHGGGLSAGDYTLPGNAPVPAIGTITVTGQYS